MRDFLHGSRVWVTGKMGKDGKVLMGYDCFHMYSKENPEREQ